MKRIILLIAIAYAACACTDIDVASDATTQASETTSQYEDVIDMATKAFNAINGESRTNSSVNVVEVQPWLTKDIYNSDATQSRSLKILPDTLLYVVNFANNAGYALVSNNEYLKAVVAIIPESNFNDYRMACIDNPGFKFYMDLYKEGYINDALTKVYDYHALSDYLASKATFSMESIDGWSTTTVYPVKLIQKWGQRSPYNQYCYTLEGEQALAGCLPVAFAQVLTYYEYPKVINGYTIDWKKTKCETPKTNEEKDNVARLIHEVGVLSNAKYGVSSTTASPESMRKQLDAWGYSSETGALNSYINEVRMIHNLYEYGPALIYGQHRDSETGKFISAHEWIIDGALAQTKNIDGQSKVRFLFHCNWGWDGRQDGYFLGTAFNPYGENGSQFNYNVEATYFIKKP